MRLHCLEPPSAAEALRRSWDSSSSRALGRDFPPFSRSKWPPGGRQANPDNVTILITWPPSTTAADEAPLPRTPFRGGGSPPLMGLQLLESPREGFSPLFPFKVATRRAASQSRQRHHPDHLAAVDYCRR